MKSIFITLAAAVGLAALPAGLTAANGSAKVGLVNFKKIIELSTLGKQEQEMYEGMKKQIEQILTDKEKEFNDRKKKLQDDDFKDSQTPEALKKLEDEFRQLGQELAQGQSQYFQAMQQANYRILQKVAEVVSKASQKVAESKGLDLILNDDNAFYNSPALDVTTEVVAEMDRMSKEELEKAPNGKEPVKLDLTK